MICLASMLSIWWYLSIYLSIYLSVYLSAYLPTYPPTYLTFNTFSQGIYSPRASLLVQRVKHLPAMWKTLVRSLGWEDPLEKEMATHSSTLAWKVPRMEELGRLQSVGSQRVIHDWATSLCTLQSFDILLLLAWADRCPYSRFNLSTKSNTYYLFVIDNFFCMVGHMLLFSYSRSPLNI